MNLHGHASGRMCRKGLVTQVNGYEWQQIKQVDRLKMAKGDWWFKFEYLKWLTDEQLNRCSLETQGFWMRCICVMRKSDVAKLQGTPTELCRLLSVTPSEFRKCFSELSITKTATVTQTANNFTLMSRKFAKELKVKEQNRLRKRKQRGHANDAPMSPDRVISKSKSNKKEEEKTQERVREQTEVQIHLGTVLAGVKKTLVVNRLTDESDWIKHGTIALENGFTAEQFVECFSLLHRQQWRTSAVRAKHVNENLPNLAKIRNEIRVQTKNGHGEKLPSLEEKLADAAAHNAGLKPPPKTKQEGNL